SIEGANATPPGLAPGIVNSLNWPLDEMKPSWSALVSLNHAPLLPPSGPVPLASPCADALAVGILYWSMSPCGSMCPTRFALGSVNHAPPAGAPAIADGCAVAVGSGYSAIDPFGLTCPTWPAFDSVNHMPRSAQALGVQADRSGAIELRPASAVGTAYWLMVPAALSEIDTSRSPPGSVNH